MIDVLYETVSYLPGRAGVRGEAFGADAHAAGRAGFTTGMCGYIETLTDPSYYGQIIMQTFPMIGNYGVIPSDYEGAPGAFGYVVREKCDAPSNFRCAMTLDAFLKERGIPGISGVDTREITRIIRNSGVMNAALSDTPSFDPTALAAYRVTDALASVSRGRTEYFPAENEKYRVALIDYGAKMNIIRELTKRGASVTAYPHTGSARRNSRRRPRRGQALEGPATVHNVYEIGRIKSFSGRALFRDLSRASAHALARARNVKLKFATARQSAREGRRRRRPTPSQNHGFRRSVVPFAPPEVARLSFVNANDGSCGAWIIRRRALRCSSTPRPPRTDDTSFLFDRFCAMMDGGENNALDKR